MPIAGPALWNKAKNLIPGGNQLLSKRPDRFLPGLWPSYYAKAKGCRVWDMDGDEYLDFAQMGVGCCTLGYADPDVNAAVTAALENGSMCSLNCPEEIELAQRLTDIHPFADMARFTRSGGEACAMAVRIARASTGKDTVAFCGYHGWHDWYLAANLASGNNLDGQLLPGLDPRGVPRGLAGSALPFMYNNLDSFKELIEQYGDSIGVIIMEPMRAEPPHPDFLTLIRREADRIGAVLIFDEITSGFRINFGGVHKTLGIEPDMAVFGKALGNGHPIGAVIGRHEVMDAAQDTFISSTMWTERVGFSAALATLEKMERIDAQAQLVKHGKRIRTGWLKLAERHGLDITVSGMDPLLHIRFNTDEPLAAMTLYAQDMLERRYLLGAAVYTTTAYDDVIIDAFLNDTDQAFARLATALADGSPRNQLKGEVIHAGFKRLA